MPRPTARPGRGPISAPPEGRRRSPPARPASRAAVSVAANGAGGAYTVTATVTGVATPAVFPLTNTAPVPSPGRPLAVGGLLNGSAVVFAPNGSGQFNTTPAATVNPFGGLGVA